MLQDERKTHKLHRSPALNEVASTLAKENARHQEMYKLTSNIATHEGQYKSTHQAVVGLAWLPYVGGH